MNTERTGTGGVGSSGVLAAGLAWLHDNGFDAEETTTIEQLQKMGMDSLDQVELVMEIEDRTCESIEDVWLEEIMDKPGLTLKQAAEMLAKHLGS